MRSSTSRSDFAVHARGSFGHFTVRGQSARALRELVEAGPTGRTALEVATWALRLAAYCYDLRKLGVEIETRRESHPGGWHARYVLLSPIEITAVIEGSA